MACLEIEHDTHDGLGGRFFWHGSNTEVSLLMTPHGPRVELDWLPVRDPSARLYLSLAEAAELADALTAALILDHRRSNEHDDKDSGTDREPGPQQSKSPGFKPAAWPQEQEF
ncbi:hypothetical protein VMT65_07560 [Nocardia sp. CDC153]|uniref:hypothetical protein n=1 Tax=Nocardia sp. CDC153 TaxID=3112167 RepID=UPI002DBBD84F|nr:hypothetical protein [Nocardia sp. CDC153]MEC3952882.1 hypothetical protein [Nocardia sp. CDC153]